MVLLKTAILIMLCFSDYHCENTNRSVIFSTKLVSNFSANLKESVNLLELTSNDSESDMNKHKSTAFISPFDFSRSSKNKPNVFAKNKTFDKIKPTADKLEQNLEKNIAFLNVSRHTNTITTDSANITANDTSGKETNRKISIEVYKCDNLTSASSTENVCSKENISSIESSSTNLPNETDFNFISLEDILSNRTNGNEIITNDQNNIVEGISVSNNNGEIKQLQPNTDTYTPATNIFRSKLYTVRPYITKLSENFIRRPKNKTVIVNGTEAVWPVKHAALLEGDLIIGGLMMVHSREDSVTCGPVMPQGGVQALEAMLYTLDVFNTNKLLPGVTLGAHVLDDCDTDTYGLEMAVDFIKG